jgi:hypothetical protein
MAATPTSVARDRGTPRAFRPGVPATEALPFGLWRLAGRVLRRPAAGLLGYGKPAGYGPLQREISDHLGPARAVRCEPGRVIVVSGSLQALDLCARVLLDPGDAAWIEEPGYRGARAALLVAGAALVPVPVDTEGLDVAAGVRRAPRAPRVRDTLAPVPARGHDEPRQAAGAGASALGGALFCMGPGGRLRLGVPLLRPAPRSPAGVGHGGSGCLRRHFQQGALPVA